MLLLDEADVFLTERLDDSFARNELVSSTVHPARDALDLDAANRVNQSSSPSSNTTRASSS
jgi:hypothetical protein